MNNQKTNFKVVLNSYDTNSWTGASKFNANYYLDLKRILSKDEYYDKSYKMSFQLCSTSSAVITNGSIYSAVIQLSNGNANKQIYQYNQTAQNTTALLKVQSEQGVHTDYTFGNTINITGTTATAITCTSTTGLAANRKIIITGPTISGLVAGTYYINTVVDSTSFTVKSQPTLTVASGTMVGAVEYTTTQSAYFQTTPYDMNPTFISNLRAITGVNISIKEHTGAVFSTTAVDYTAILYFEEIDGDD